MIRKECEYLLCIDRIQHSALNMACFVTKSLRIANLSTTAVGSVDLVTAMRCCTSISGTGFIVARCWLGQLAHAVISVHMHRPTMRGVCFMLLGLHISMLRQRYTSTNRGGMGLSCTGEASLSGRWRA